MPPKKRTADANGDSDKKRRKKKADPENGNEIEDLPDDTNAEPVIEPPLIHGEVLICGGMNWDLMGRRQIPKGVKNMGGPNLWGPHRIAALQGMRVRTVAQGCVACHCLVITNEGKAYSWGRNDKGQLGHGDTLRRDIPTLIESLADINIVDAGLGRNHTLLLSDKGTVYGVGCNMMGQLGLGHQSAMSPSPTRTQYRGPPIKRIACGGEFSVIVDIRGNCYTFGHPEYGQLGHNSDGKYFVSSNKLTYNSEAKPRRVVVFVEKGRDGHVTPVNDVEVTEVACGANHTVVLDNQKRVFTWGFGGYGRLGHAEPKDEMMPRLVKSFEGPNRGAKSIAAGSQFSLALNEWGGLYFWGQSKPTGEATMYPKPVMDLNGWNIRSMGCSNRSIVVAADESIVSWGTSPTFGELGFGDNKAKSSPNPQELKTLDGVYIHKVACGLSHTLMLARNDSEEDENNLDKLPVFKADENK